IPNLRAVLMIRQAVSPRLAIRIRLNMWPFCTASRQPRNWLRIAGACYTTVLYQRYLPRHPIMIAENAMSFRSEALISAACAAIFLQGAMAQAQSQRNLILFVPDGLRALSVTPETAPAMADVRDKGVNFANPHSLFPTFTMANASGMSTGHFLGDTGVFSNTIYVGFPTAHAANSVTPFIESDPVLGDIDDHFSGIFVDEDAVLFAARHQGFSTAAIGKVGPTMMFDH